MKKYTYLWLGIGAVLLYLFATKKISFPTFGAAGSVPNPGTKTNAPNPPSQGVWGTVQGLFGGVDRNIQMVQGTAKTIGDEVSSAGNAINSVLGLFGNASKATGTANPVTSGSGTAVPSTPPADTPNGAIDPVGDWGVPADAFMSPPANDTSSSDLTTFDNWTMGDFAGN